MHAPSSSSAASLPAISASPPHPSSAEAFPSSDPFPEQPFPEAVPERSMGLNDADDDETPTFLSRLQFSLIRLYNQKLDESVPYLKLRWVGFGIILLFYTMRVYALDGFFIITYGLGISLLNLLIGFVTPIDNNEGPVLPTTERGEFKPLERRLSEFKFWYVCVCVCVCVYVMLIRVTVVCLRGESERLGEASGDEETRSMGENGEASEAEALSCVMGIEEIIGSEP